MKKDFSGGNHHEKVSILVSIDTYSPLYLVISDMLESIYGYENSIGILFQEVIYLLDESSVDGLRIN